MLCLAPIWIELFFQQIEKITCHMCVTASGDSWRWVGWWRSPPNRVYNWSVSVKCRCKCRSPALIPSQPLSRLIENRNRPSAATSALPPAVLDVHCSCALRWLCHSYNTKSNTLGFRFFLVQHHATSGVRTGKPPTQALVFLRSVLRYISLPGLLIGFRTPRPHSLSQLSTSQV